MSFFIISICCKVMQNAGRASPFTEAKASRMFCSSACILETNSQWSDGDQESIFIPKRPKHSCLAVLRIRFRRCWQLVHTFKPLKQIEFLGLTHLVALKVLKKSFRKSSLLPSAWQHFGALKRFGTCHVEGQMTTPFLFPQLRFIKVHDPVEKDQPILRPCHPAAVSSPCSIGIYIRKVKTEKMLGTCAIFWIDAPTKLVLLESPWNSHFHHFLPLFCTMSLHNHDGNFHVPIAIISQFAGATREA